MHMIIQGQEIQGPKEKGAQSLDRNYKCIVPKSSSSWNLTQLSLQILDYGIWNKEHFLFLIDNAEFLSWFKVTLKILETEFCLVCTWS